METRLRFLRVALILFSILLFSCGSDDHTITPVARPEFGTFRWPSFPVELHVDSSLTNDKNRQKDLRIAMAFWEKRAGKKLFHAQNDWQGPGMPFTGAADNPDSISENVLVFQGNWPFESNMTGWTSVRVNAGNITGAVILLDPQSGYCSGLCEDNSEATSLRRLLAHELGHFLGFAHSPYPQNIMYSSILPGGSLGDRTVDDVALHRLTD